jgi:TRAP-type uncharacterized transport system substrate-binding protein
LAAFLRIHRRCGILCFANPSQLADRRYLRVKNKTSRGVNAMLKRMLAVFTIVSALGFTGSPAWSQPKDIRWGTPPVGTSGHKAMVILSSILNKEMPQYRISVLPTAGAITTVKGYATHEYDGMYGSDIGFHELATDTNRFKGFKSRVKRQPMQSFWSNTIEVGMAVHARNKDKIKKWGDLNGKRIFTGPLPFDTRAHTERALAALGVKFTYVQIDLAVAGSQLESGTIDAMHIYTGGESAPPPWLAEASLAADWAALNPSLKRSRCRREGPRRHRESARAPASATSTSQGAPNCHSITASMSVPKMLADDVYKC